MIPVSVIVITRNEAHNIEACLETVRWSSDLVVVDAQSKDDTVEIARRCGARVFIEPWLGFAEAKTFAVSQTMHDWVLWLDADERVTPELAADIGRLVANEVPHAAYEVARRAYFLGRWIRHSGWYPGYVARLFDKRRARFTEAEVHEGLIVSGTVGRLSNDLLHYTDPVLYHYVAKFDRYTSLAAGQLHANGRRFRLSDLIVRPPWVFLRMYLLRLGFLDGVPGLLLALLSASYVFVKYAKVWESGRSETTPVS